MLGSGPVLAALVLFAGQSDRVGPAVPPLEPIPPVCFGATLIGFESGSAELTSRARRQLDDFLDFMGRSATPSSVDIGASADSVGSETANLRLSRRRGAAVMDYLMARGVQRSRIEIAARGETSLLTYTPDETAEANNRSALVQERPTLEEIARREAIWARRGRPRIVC